MLYQRVAPDRLHPPAAVVPARFDGVDRAGLAGLDERLARAAFVFDFRPAAAAFDEAGAFDGGFHGSLS